jgi:hypothetical protein
MAKNPELQDIASQPLKKLSGDMKVRKYKNAFFDIYCLYLCKNIIHKDFGSMDF